MPSQMLGGADYEDILNGATLYGSGGGGPRWMGEQILQQIGDGQIELVECGDVPDDADMAIVSFFGAPVGFRGANDDYGQITAVAFQQLAQTVQKKFAYIVPLETGAGNSLIPLAVAAKLGLPVVDVDGARRAMPSPFCATWGSLPLTAMAAASAKVSMTASVPDLNFALETMAAIFTKPSPMANGSGLALWAMTGAQMKSAALVGSLSDSLKLGQAVRNASTPPGNPLQAATDYLQGEVLGVGTVKTSFIPATMGTGNVVFACGDVNLTVITSSENVLVWSDQSSAPLAVAPDLISFMTTTGVPLAAFDLDGLPAGTEVAIIRSPADPKLYQSPILDAYMAVLSSVGYMGQPPSSTHQ